MPVWHAYTGLLNQNYVVQQFDKVEINDLRFENTLDKS